MKNETPPNKSPNSHFNTNKHRPENKDDIDSREGEEQIFKGDSVTHNTKEHQNLKSKTPNKKSKK